ncbi:MAG: Hsp20/alpha crystallin family protein [Syntrophales bacterium]
MVNEKQELQTHKKEAPVEAERTRNRRVYIPSVDIIEKKDAIILLADMPGVDENAVNIVLDKNVLTISGTVEVDHHKGYDLSYAEYGVGDYERAFTLSEGIDQDKIEATVTNGVLRLILPKAEPLRPKKIEVKAS